MDDTVLNTMWEIRWSNSQSLPYFYDINTNASMWEIPPGLTQQQALQLPGSEILEDYYRNKQQMIRARHILLKTQESRRPVDRKGNPISRTRSESIAQLESAFKKLNDGPNTDEAFAKFAKEHSDCSSAEQGGDLGFFGKGEMQPEFEKAAFSLPIGGTSNVVHTDSGEHLIKRIA